jgi:EmrB/QacA subfamily drug resistance transporter
VLANTTGSLALVMFNQTSLTVALPSIQRELHVSTTGLQWVVNAYVLALAALVPLGGRLGDRFGRRTLFVAGMTTFGAMSVIASAAQGEVLLIVARAGQGAGAALMQPAATALVMNTFAPGERGRAAAIQISVSTLVTAAGPLIGGALTEFVSWRAVLLASVPIALAGLALTWFVRPPNEPDPSRSLDVRGAVLMVAGLGALVTGLQQGPDWGWGSAAVIVCVVGGLALLGLLAIVERLDRQPLLALGLFRDRHMAVGSLVVAGQRFALLGITVFASLYLQDTLGFSPFDAGLAIMPALATLVVATQISGVWYDRSGGRLPLGVGTALVGLALLGTAPLLGHDSYPLLLPGLVIAGAGLGLCSPAVIEALRDVPATARGQAAGMVQTARQLGGSIGVAAVGAVYTAGGLDSAFVVSAVVLGLVGLNVLAALPGRTDPVGEVHPVPG